MYAEIYIKDELLVSWQADLFDIYDNSRLLNEQSTVPLSLKDKTDYHEFISSMFMKKIHSQMAKNNISNYYVFIFFSSKLNGFPVSDTDELPT